MMLLTEYSIQLTQKAKNDIIDIGDYIAHTLLQPDTAKYFIKNLRNSISQLNFFPYKFPIVQDYILAKQKIRCMPYKNYYVFYRVLESSHTIIVLRIGYNQRNWKDILS